MVIRELKGAGRMDFCVPSVHMQEDLFAPVSTPGYRRVFASHAMHVDCASSSWEKVANAYLLLNRGRAQRRNRSARQ
jgi:hypothetical protein